jgi:hypothetical protein
MLSAFFTPVSSKAVQDDEFRAVWVATVFNLDFPSRPGLSVDQLKKETDEILNSIADMGYNAVILQVRPTTDAFYKSSFFPWSNYLTGTQGVAPANGFDPLEYWNCTRGLIHSELLREARITEITIFQDFRLIIPPEEIQAGQLRTPMADFISIPVFPRLES